VLDVVISPSLSKSSNRVFANLSPYPREVSMKNLSILALSMMLGACGAPPTGSGSRSDLPSWSRPNVTQDRIDQDESECGRDARMQSPSFGSSMAGAQRAQDLQEQCMKSKGYHRVRKDGTRMD
jgi:hypothetical protein